MWLMRLAIRNLLRNKTRTAVTGSAIALSFALVSTLNHFEYGAWQERVRGSVEAVSGHVVVQHPQYVDDPKVERAVLGSGEVASTLRNAFPRARVLRRAFVGGLLASPRNTAPLLVVGVEPEAEAQVSRIDDLFTSDEGRTQGSWFLTEETNGVVLGRPVAQSLEVQVGDRVVLMTQAGDELQSVPLVVRGIFSTGIDRADAQVAYAPLWAVQPLLVDDQSQRPMVDPAHQVAVHFASDRGLDARAAEATTAIGRADVVALTWSQALPSLKAEMDLDRNFSKVIHSFIALIVVVVILTTLLMSALERTREIGLLMALGMRPLQIQIMFWFEALLLAVAGLISGVVLHLLPYWYLSQVGVDYGDIAAGSTNIAGVVFDPVMRARFDIDSMLIYAPLTLIVTVIASLWPAWRASRLVPVDAMRHT